MSPPDGPALQRRLGTFDAVTIGLGSMVGAGIFVALGPAAAAAGSGLLIGLAVAAVVAYCNATSSARLAAVYPQSGGTYVYGRERLGEFWGYAAGWSFVVGKTASCAAMALTVGYYVWPDGAHAVAVAAVVALTAVNYAGIQKSAMLTRVIVALVLAVLAAVVVVVLGFGDVDGSRLGVGRRRRHPWCASGRGVVVLRVRGIRPDRDAGRRGPRTGPHYSARHPDRARHHPGGVRGGGGRRAERVGQRRTGFGERAAGGRGARGRLPRNGAPGPGGCRCRRLGLAVGA